MAIFLVLQAHSTLFEVGLFLNTQCLASKSEDKKYSSRNLIPAINTLLESNNLTLNDIDAIGVNQGPGPFTSLRIALTIVNGLNFATGIPLIGHISLEALLLEFKNEKWPHTVALLNAFNNDLYYGYYTKDGLKIGCLNNDLLFELLRKNFAQDKDESRIRFLGNGASLYENKIAALFPTASVLNPLPHEPSLQQLAYMTVESFEAKKNLENLLLPHYLKDIAYQPQV